MGSLLVYAVGVKVAERTIRPTIFPIAKDHRFTDFDAFFDASKIRVGCTREI